MILDFQEAQRVPVVTPDGTEYKYRPSGVDITLKKLKLPHVDIPQFASVDVINKLMAESKLNLNNDYKENTKQISELAKAKAELKRNFNSNIAQLKTDKAAAADAPAAKAIDALILTYTFQYNRDNKKIDDEMKKIGTEMTNIEGSLAGLDAEAAELIRKFEENQAKIVRVDRINKEKIGEYI